MSMSSSSTSSTKAPGDSGLNRIIIGLFGEMNAGKSSTMNCLTQQATAIVDKTPGTTADVKAAVMQLHGLGPIKLLDTAGIDDVGELGMKKKEKSMNALKEVDLALVIIDPSTKLKDGKAAGDNEACEAAADDKGLALLTAVVTAVAKKGRKAMLIFNLKEDKMAAIRSQRGDACMNQLLASIERHISHSVQRDLKQQEFLQSSSPSHLLPSFIGDFSRMETGKALALHLIQHMKGQEAEVPLVPPQYNDKVVFLNIPMDAETPQGRLLRPQALVQEYCLRNFIPTMAYRMDLRKARSSNAQERDEEKKRFLGLIEKLPKGSLIMTDSQAIDIVHPWTQDLDYDLTTFSIAMIHFMSGGHLQTYVDGLDALLHLREKDQVLISEACNHVRIPEVCDDIGLVQIPQKISSLYPNASLQLDHAYGREFPSIDLAQGKYKLVISCGGCMLDKQKIRARMEDCQEAQVPVTNYGIFLSYMTSPKALIRAVQPWGVQVSKLIATEEHHPHHPEYHRPVRRRVEKEGPASCQEHLRACAECPHVK